MQLRVEPLVLGRRGHPHLHVSTPALVRRTTRARPPWPPAPPRFDPSACAPGGRLVFQLLFSIQFSISSHPNRSKITQLVFYKIILLNFNDFSSPGKRPCCTPPYKSFYPPNPKPDCITNFHVPPVQPTGTTSKVNTCGPSH